MIKLRPQVTTNSRTRGRDVQIVWVVLQIPALSEFDGTTAFKENGDGIQFELDSSFWAFHTGCIERCIPASRVRLGRISVNSHPEALSGFSSNHEVTPSVIYRTLVVAQKEAPGRAPIIFRVRASNGDYCFVTATPVEEAVWSLHSGETRFFRQFSAGDRVCVPLGV